MSRVLPILFNTEMVRAIMDGRKTATRRLIKNPPHPDMPDNHNYCRMQFFVQEYLRTLHYMDVIKQNPFRQIRYFESLAPYDKGDILYVRETWAFQECNVCKQIDCHKTPDIRCEDKISIEGCYIYYADHPHPERIIWRPSIHMPKAAARLWIKVTDVQPQRLKDMTLDDFIKEGIILMPEAFNDPENAYVQARSEFIQLWDSTIPKRQQDIYSWASNPWVWTTEFKRCERPEL